MEADELIKNEKKVGREARREEGDWGTQVVENKEKDQNQITKQKREINKRLKSTNLNYLSEHYSSAEYDTKYPAMLSCTSPHVCALCSFMIQSFGLIKNNFCMK